ncbi:hypothetical protein GW17_00018259 [Ensete ventricosum]|nr:hypothetical protein GW17_00018259 [Ensete ventricosum]
MFGQVQQLPRKRQIPLLHPTCCQRNPKPGVTCPGTLVPWPLVSHTHVPLPGSTSAPSPSPLSFQNPPPPTANNSLGRPRTNSDAMSPPISALFTA